jgi:hypothetical protein
MHDLASEKQEDIAIKKPQEVAQQTTKRLESVFEAYQSLCDSCTVTENIIGDILRKNAEDVSLLAGAKTFRLETIENQEKNYHKREHILKIWLS